MVDRFVIDASVAVAYLVDEVGSLPAQAAIADWQTRSAKLVVPSHFWLEVTNALVRGNGFSPAEVVAELVDMDVLELTTIEPDRPLLLLAIDQMVRKGLTAYDAIYLALALATDARLATLDRRLAAAAGNAGMLIGAAGIAEPVADYLPDAETNAGWTHSAVVGAHIAELRRRALAET